MKPQWNFSEVVKQMLQFYADKVQYCRLLLMWFMHMRSDSLLLINIPQGDVQMSVSAILVLGDMINGLLDIKIVEQWFSSYIGVCVCV